jgi:hypothetical protein
MLLSATDIHVLEDMMDTHVGCMAKKQEEIHLLQMITALMSC